MKRPIFVRAFREGEREALERGLHSCDAFVLRRCQILLGSARGEWAPRIGLSVGVNEQTVRNAIRAFNERGLDSLRRGSSRPHTTHAAFGGEELERLKGLISESPRSFGRSASLWTLKLLAEVSFEEGLTKEQVSGETVRASLARLGISWQRAKKWITSPDERYSRKKAGATG